MGCLCSSKLATGHTHKKKKHGLFCLQSSYNEGLYCSSRICFQVIISDHPYLKFSLRRARSTSISKYLFTLYFVPVFCALGSIVFGSADSIQCLTHPRPSALPLSSMPSPRNFTAWFTTIYIYLHPGELTPSSGLRTDTRHIEHSRCAAETYTHKIKHWFKKIKKT